MTKHTAKRIEMTISKMQRDEWEIVPYKVIEEIASAARVKTIEVMEYIRRYM